MAGVFPTSASPTGTTPPPVAPPPGVGTFPSISLSNEFVKVRWFEPNVPSAVNRRWAGMPRGVYIGFRPTTTPGSRVVTLGVDPDQNFSLLKVISNKERVMVDIFTGDDIALDFSGHNVWPVYVLATATYQERTQTQGKIFTRASLPTGIDEIVLCAVNKVGNDLVIDLLEPTNRQEPVAFLTQPYGYMPNGSITDLATTNATVAEVITARDSTYTGGHGTLADRLAADMGGTELADRLGLRLVHIISNIHPNRSGSSINVSGSFSITGREFGPVTNIDPNGSEVAEGALTGGGRNICFMIDGTTGQRLIDEVSREVVYGLLTSSTAGIGGGKEVHFVNASTSVNGNLTNPFAAPLEEGDLLEGPDGLFYEVVTIVDPDNAVLGSAYQGTDAFILAPSFKRWLTFLFTVSGGVYNIVTPTAVQFLFPSFFRVDQAIFDGLLLIKKNGERPPLPLATDTTAGKALLAADGGLVGSFRTIKNAGSSAGGDIHTLNFTSGGATNAGGGVASVSVPGAVGPTGPGANLGPDGPTGAAGFGYSLLNGYESGPETGTTLIAVGPVSVSFTHDWTAPASTPTLAPGAPRAYAHATCGWSIINGFGPGFERIHIDEFVDAGASSTRITYRIEPVANLSNTTLGCFMGASQ